MAKKIRVIGRKVDGKWRLEGEDSTGQTHEIEAPRLSLALGEMAGKLILAEKED